MRARHDADESSFKRKIASRTLHVAVIGLGYVGSPLATTFATEGFQVTGIDIDQQKVDQAARGESYISDISNKILRELIEAERLLFTSLFASLDDVDAIGICVPTPLLKTRSQDVSYIITELQERQAVVIYNDEYVPPLTLRGKDLHSQPLSSGLL